MILPAYSQAPMIDTLVDADLYNVIWSPDNELITVAGSLGVFVFDTSLNEIATLYKDTGAISVSWNSTSSQLLIGDDLGNIQIWNRDGTDNFSYINSLSSTLPSIYNNDIINKKSVISLMWNHSDTRIASITSYNIQGGLDSIDIIEIWDVDTGNIEPIIFDVNPEILGLSNAIEDMAWSPDGSKLIVGAIDKGIYIYDSYTGLMLDEVYDADGFSWYQDQKLALAGPNISIFDTFNSNAKRIAGWSTYQYYKRILWKSDREIIVMSAFAIEVWDIYTGTILYGVNINPPIQDPMKDYFKDIALDITGENIVVIYDRNHISIYDISDLGDVSLTATITPWITPTIMQSPTPTLTPVPTSQEKIAFTQYVSGTAQTFTVNLDGSGSTNISNPVVSQCDAVYSLDGRKIAYTSPCVDENNLETSPIGQIYVRDLASGNTVSVTSGLAPNYKPVWSADSLRLAFTSTRNPYWDNDPTGDADIYTTFADGSTKDNPQWIGLGDTHELTGDWSVDNSVVFTSSENGSTQLYWTGALGGVVEQVTVSYPNLGSPRWSPDGQRIAFRAGLLQEKIYLFDITTEIVSEFTPVNLNVDQLDWSPYNNQLVFTALKDGYLQLFVADLTSGGVRQLTSDPTDKFHPSWSPSINPVVVATPTPMGPTPTAILQDKISFTQYVEDHNQIFTMNLDGSSVTPLSNNNYDELDGVLSPDGSKFAFASRREDYSQIFVKDLSTLIDMQVTYMVRNSYSPTWSPDGQWLAFMSEVNQTNEIFVIRSDASSNPMMLTTNNIDDFNPQWSSNNRLSYASEVDSETSIHWMDMDAPFHKGVVNEECSQFQWSPSGNLMACLNASTVSILSSQGDLLYLRNIGNFSIADFAWSPDETQLIFTGDGQRGMIFDLQTYRVEKFQVDAYSFFDPIGDLDWSTGQNRLPFVPFPTAVAVNQIAYENNLSQVELMNIDGSDINVVGTIVSSDASLSHDGLRIAYIGAFGKLLIKDLNDLSVDPVEITTNCTASPAWSPDDKHIIAESTCNNGGLFIIPVDPLFTDVVDFCGGSLYCREPDWSIGNQIVFSGNNQIYIMWPYSTELIPLTDNQYINHTPRWSPDGTTIAYVSERNGNQEIILIDADGANEITLATINGSIDGLSWSHDGERILFAKNNQLFTVGTASNSEIVKLLNDTIQRANPDWRVNLNITSTPVPPTQTPIPSEIIVSRNTNLVIEGGAEDTYTLLLRVQPTADVIVNVTVTNQVTISPSTLTFTPQNWDVPQTVTVSAFDDLVAEGTHSVLITHSVVSADVEYNGISVADVSVSIEDDDDASIIITETGDNTSLIEGAASDNYSIALTSVPSAVVNVTITSDAQCEISGNQGAAYAQTAELSFEDTTAQHILIRAIDDLALENTHSCIVNHSVTSIDTNYYAFELAPITAQITDNDVASVIFSETSVSVSEGSTTATYTIYLTGAPTSNVTLTIGGTGTQATVNTNTLTFTSINHYQPQTITVTAVNDSVAEGLHTATLTHTLTTTDTNYTALPAQPSLTVIITDNDTVGVIITQSGGNTTVTEGGATDTYTIRLNSKPTANVTVNLSGTSQASVSPATMTFTTTNWNTAKTATVTAVNDTIEEGNHTSSIAHNVTSSDMLYNGFTVSSVSVNIIDNDVFNADAGFDQSHQIPHDGMVIGSETAYVTLNGSQSTGPITGYQWRRQNNSTILSTNASHTLQLPVGTHTFILTVTDGTRTDTDTVTINVSLCMAPCTPTE